MGGATRADFGLVYRYGNQIGFRLNACVSCANRAIMVPYV